MSYFKNKDYLFKHAIDIIRADYGDTVSIEEKNKDLLKFGRNTQVQTTRTTLMTLPAGIYNETYLSTNAITTVSSSSALDTQDIVVEGHTISGGLFTFVTQTITLNGQNQVSLTTPLARSTRAYNDGITDLAGTVYFYETGTSTAGVPDTPASVHLMIDIGFNNSEKAATTVSNTDYWILTDFYADCLEKVTTFGIVHLEVRRAGKVFRNVIDRSCNDTSNVLNPFNPYIIVPKNADIRLMVSASANGKDFSGGISGVLAKVI